MMRVTITHDHLYDLDSVGFDDDTDTVWTFPTNAGPVADTLYAEVYDDDGALYYSITVEGMPLNQGGDDYASEVVRLFDRHVGATRVVYVDPPEHEIG